MEKEAAQELKCISLRSKQQQESTYSHSLVKQQTLVQEELDKEEAEEKSKRIAEQTRRNRLVTQGELEDNYKHLEDSIKKLEREIFIAKDLIKSMTSLALSISDNYSRVVKEKDFEISQYVYKCYEIDKHVSELQEKTAIATNTVSTF